MAHRLVEGPSLANPIQRNFTVTSGGAATVGEWVLGETTLGTVANAASGAAGLTGLALNTAAAGATVQVLIPQPGDVFEGTYTGTVPGTPYFVGVSLTTSGVINYASPTQALFLPLSKNTTASTVRYSVNPAKLTAPGGSALA